MRRLRAFPGATPLAVAVIATLTTLPACDRGISPERRIERAQVAFDAGEYANAMRDLKTALESQPRNAAGRVLLARVSLRVGDAEASRKELERAIEAGADPAALRDLHYATLFAQGRYEDALRDADADEGFDRVRRLVVAARAHLDLGRHDEAEATLGQALALSPDDTEARLLQVRSLWMRGKLEESAGTLDQLMAKHPTFARGDFYRGRIAMARGDPRQASEAFERARLNGRQLDLPERFAVLAGLVESKLALGDTAGAETDLKALEAWAPDAFMTHYLRARLVYSRRDFPAAAAHLQRALALRPDHAAVRLLLGAALIEQGALEQAASVLTAMIADHPESIEARKLLARAHLLRNDPTEAVLVLDEAPAGARSDVGADWLSGSLRVLSGRTDEGILLLERAARADSANAQLRLDLAQAYVIAGRRDEALALLRSIPAEQGGIRRQQLTVLAEISGMERAQARDAIHRLVAENPKDSSLLAVSGFHLLGAGNPAEAEELFDRAVAADARNHDARLGLAAVALQKDDSRAAEEQLRAVLESDAANERAYLALARIALARSDREGARQWLEKSVGANPAVVDSRLRLAELAYDDKDAARAGALLDQALKVAKDRGATLLAVGQIHATYAQFDEALKRFNEAAAFGVKQAEVGGAAAMLALGRHDEARSRLEAVTREHPNWLAPTVLLVGLDSNARRVEAALARITAFEKAGGAAASANELRGHVLAAANRHQQAAQAYARAFAVQPTASLAVKVFAARKAAGEPAPEATLSSWLEQHPRDVTVRIALAEHYRESGKRPDAIRHYEQALEVGQHPSVLNNLAWLYYETRDARALDTAYRAHGMAPRNAAIADTYGWILLEQGRTSEALEVLATAARAAPQDPEIQYHHAAALARADKKEHAVAALQKLLDAATPFASRREAEALLKSLK